MSPLRESAPRSITVKLNPQSVVNKILKSLSDTLAVIQVCVPAIRDAEFKAEEPQPRDDATDYPEGSRIPMGFRLNDRRSPEDKRTACSNWLLARGFQELARAVREALEEAYVYLAAFEFFQNPGPVTWGEFSPAIQQARKEAGSLCFPELLARVSSRAAKPLHFEEEFRSFQRCATVWSIARAS